MAEGKDLSSLKFVDNKQDGEEEDSDQQICSM